MPLHRRFPVLDVVAVIAIALSGVAVLVPQRSGPAPGRSRPEGVVLSPAGPVRLSPSAGDLYWTARDGLHRMPWDGGPGADVVAGRADRGTWLGAVAVVGGIAYVVANDPRRGTSQIARVSPPAVVATSPHWVGDRDLITDGTGLFWADAAGVRGVSPDGGDVRTLASAASITGLDTDGGRIFYAGGNEIRSVGPAGHDTRTEATTTQAVVALVVRAGILSWAESDGSVRQRGVTFAGPERHRRVTDIGYAEGRLVWTDCDPLGRACRLVRDSDGVNSTAEVGRDPRDLVSDGITTVLICDDHLVRHVQPLPPAGPRRFPRD